jgi:SAM-dependent methyltransferase
MGIKIIEKPELGSLVSPHRNREIPIHNWYLYKHGYSRDLADYLVKNLNLSAGSWVLDPFCGGGTTLLTCKELGINAYGFDILPFSVFLSTVKIRNYDIKEIARQLDILKKSNIDRCHSRTSLPDIPLVRKAFKPEMQRALLALKSKIDSISDLQAKSFFDLGFLSILESVSNTSKAGGFLRIIDRDISPEVIKELFFNKINAMLNDVIEESRSKQDRKVIVTARIGDARKLPTKRRFDAVITSPPYPNRHDYTRIYSLEMMFDFISSNDQLKKIRYETLRSHVEARKKYEVIGYKRPDRLEFLIAQVKRNGTNNPQVITMLEGYFEDMYLSLSEIQRCLRNGGKIAMVISNVRFAGVNILVDEILSEIGLQVGLIPLEIWAIRYRGNSSQQMRDYMRSPSRESVIFWGKNA